MSSNAPMTLMLPKPHVVTHGPRLRREGGGVRTWGGWAVMIRVAAILLLAVAACAHDHALERRDVGAMENASPAISPWTGPEVNPIAIGQTDADAEAALSRVHEMAVQVRPG